MQDGAGHAGIKANLKDCDGLDLIKDCDADVVVRCVRLECDAGRELISHWTGLDNGA